MKIYTKTGDNGQTSLFGGHRVSKDDLRIESYGTVDELNSVLGMALHDISDKKLHDVIFELQNELFVLGSDLATPKSDSGKDRHITRISAEHVERLEKLIDTFTEEVPPLKYFILPGGSRAASWLHIGRTICRRAERKVVTLYNNVDIGAHIVVYLNRLSDLLFVLARYANKTAGVPDVKWEK